MARSELRRMDGSRPPGQRVRGAEGRRGRGSEGHQPYAPTSESGMKQEQSRLKGTSFAAVPN